MLRSRLCLFGELEVASGATAFPPSPLGQAQIEGKSPSSVLFIPLQTPETAGLSVSEALLALGVFPMRSTGACALAGRPIRSGAQRQTHHLLHSCLSAP